MRRSDDQIAVLIRQAQAGSQEALGRLLEGCRGYLLRIAGEDLDPRLRPKGGASDIVQETFLEAQRDFAGFVGDTERELVAWLRQRLRFRIAKFVRSHRHAAKRAAAREVPLEPSGFSSAAGPALVADEPTPSERALAGERDHLLEAAMGRLPEDYRRVIDLRYREGLSFDAIGATLGRTPNSARKLWVRAIEHLKHELGTTNT
jgi:RNA polymerase sigma-70 factor (ECF subfamily)